jgi:hypothetical protein
MLKEYRTIRRRDPEQAPARRQKPVKKTSRKRQIRQ